MRLYLDLCCFNRPWDDQSQDRVRLETEAKLLIQERVRSGSATLAWSYILDHECSLNPYSERRSAISRWRSLAAANIVEHAGVLERATEFQRSGIAAFDALHLACAEAASADMFVSTDDRLLRKAARLSMLPAVLPAQALARLEGWYEDRN